VARWQLKFSKSKTQPSRKFPSPLFALGASAARSSLKADLLFSGVLKGVRNGWDVLEDRAVDGQKYNDGVERSLQEQVRLNVKVNKRFIHVPAGTDNYGTVSRQ
jgi:hypothetical protein